MDKKYIEDLKRLAGISEVAKTTTSKRSSKLYESQEETYESPDRWKFTLRPVRNEWGDYTVKAYKNGVYDEDATYYTDDWDSAVATKEKLEREYGSPKVVEDHSEDLGFGDADELDTDEVLPDEVVNLDDEEPVAAKTSLGNVDQLVQDIMSFTDKYSLEKLYMMPVAVLNKIYDKVSSGMAESAEIHDLKRLAGIKSENCAGAVAGVAMPMGESDIIPFDAESEERYKQELKDKIVASGCYSDEDLEQLTAEELNILATYCGVAAEEFHESDERNSKEEIDSDNEEIDAEEKIYEDINSLIEEIESHSVSYRADKLCAMPIDKLIKVHESVMKQAFYEDIDLLKARSGSEPSKQDPAVSRWAENLAQRLGGIVQKYKQYPDFRLIVLNLPQGDLEITQQMEDDGSERTLINFNNVIEVLKDAPLQKVYFTIKDMVMQSTDESMDLEEYSEFGIDLGEPEEDEWRSTSKGGRVHNDEFDDEPVYRHKDSLDDIEERMSLIDDIMSYSDKDHDESKLMILPISKLRALHSRLNSNEAAEQINLGGEITETDGTDVWQVKFTPKRNEYDEFVVKTYKNGKEYEDGHYYTDDLESALSTLASMKKQLGITEDTDVPGSDFDLQNGYKTQGMCAKDYFPSGAASNVADRAGPASAKQGDNPLQKRFESIGDFSDYRSKLEESYRKFKNK